MHLRERGSLRKMVMAVDAILVSTAEGLGLGAS